MKAFSVYAPRASAAMSEVARLFRTGMAGVRTCVTACGKAALWLEGKVHSLIFGRAGHRPT